MKMKRRQALLNLSHIVALPLAVIPRQIWASTVSVDDSLESIGGSWHLRMTPEKEPTYLYRDGDLMCDLFSYHRQDSNDDGIANVRITHDQDFLIIESQGYPNHPTARFPNDSNPNSILVQQFVFRLPLIPKKADTISRLPMGPIGMANNGVVFFNPFEAGGMNAVEGYSEVWLDSCCGHPQQTGVYHYHKYPACVKSPFKDDGANHSPILGFAFDGFPIHGPYEAKEQFARDGQGDRALDVCNGHEDPMRGYHYHVTPNRFPYIIGGYRGVPERSNNRGIGRAIAGGPIVDNQEGSSRIGWQIESLQPGSGKAGSQITVTGTLESTFAATVTETPSWVQIGPVEATAIRRDGNKIEADLSLPEDLAAGILLDLHLEFPGRTGRSTVIKKNDLFRPLP
jgi:hypothetical protein